MVVPNMVMKFSRVEMCYYFFYFFFTCRLHSPATWKVLSSALLCITLPVGAILQRTVIYHVVILSRNFNKNVGELAKSIKYIKAQLYQKEELKKLLTSSLLMHLSCCLVTIDMKNNDIPWWTSKKVAIVSHLNRR